MEVNPEASWNQIYKCLGCFASILATKPTIRSFLSAKQILIWPSPGRALMHSLHFWEAMAWVLVCDGNGKTHASEIWGCFIKCIWHVRLSRARTSHRAELSASNLGIDILVDVSGAVHS